MALLYDVDKDKFRTTLKSNLEFISTLLEDTETETFGNFQKERTFKADG